MKILGHILFLLLATGLIPVNAQQNNREFEFFGETIVLPYCKPLTLDGTLTVSLVQDFTQSLNSPEYLALLAPLLDYKNKNQPDDWLYYQLVRKAAETVSPKQENYYRYTLFKWFFMTRSGYDAIITLADNKIFFYAASENNIYNIPMRVSNGKHFICLNYHDYAPVDFDKLKLEEVTMQVPGAVNNFSYKITRLPQFREADYLVKEIGFTYNHTAYQFRVKLNPEVKNIFRNYPNADYESHFNMPLSKETYASLVPSLKTAVKGLNEKNGVEFLLHFTRHTFSFKTDTEVFGAEKRLSPELTLLYDYSDCEDRAALFYFLVKEIYGLPMVVLTYPEHVSVAIQFDKPVGQTILYKGKRYSLCDPSPQKKELKVGQTIPALKNVPFEISYAYTPSK